MKRFLFIFSILFVTSIFSQQTTKKSNLEAHFNWARHGTGDINGFLYGVNYQQNFGKKIYWVVGFEGTFHDDPQGVPLSFEYQGKTFNSDIRYVIAGMQLIGGVKYNLIQSDKHSVGVSIFTLLRYQADSINDVIVTSYPANTNLPIPVRILINEEPSRTFAVGGIIRLHYSYTFGKNFYAGIQAGFQADTNEDNIIQAGLKFGKTFNW